MARYRIRKRGADEWSEPMRLTGLLREIRARQHRQGPPFRHRKRSEKGWRRWWTRPWAWRQRLRSRLIASRLRTVWQVQMAGFAGPVWGILKFRPQPPAPTIGEQVIAEARSCIGIPYGFGDANGPDDPGTDSLDCSGFTQYTWGTVGVFLPHAARLQQIAANVQTFTDESKCQPGDLVLQWFENSRGIPRGTASHVGHWVSPGIEIDTRSPRSPVAMREIERGSVICYGRPQPPGQQR